MSEQAICPLCGRLIPQQSGTFVQINSKEDPSAYILCHDECGQVYGHSCMTCRHQQSPAPQCLAEKYNGPLDIIQMIRVEKHIGPATLIQEAPQVNVKVIEEVCPTCKCGSPWNCQKFHVCDNWEIKEELKDYVIRA